MNADIDHSTLTQACCRVGSVADCASWYTREVAEKLAARFPDKPVLDLTLAEILEIHDPAAWAKMKGGR